MKREFEFVRDKLEFPIQELQRSHCVNNKISLDFDTDLPLDIHLFICDPEAFVPQLAWHRYLEIIVNLDALVKFRVDDQELKLEPGELLIVDNMKLHGMVNAPSEKTRLLVIRFEPGLVYAPGSPLYDYRLLLPFFCRSPERRPVFGYEEGLSEKTFFILKELLITYFRLSPVGNYKSGCRAWFLTFICDLSSICMKSKELRLEFNQYLRQSDRFEPLLSYIKTHLIEGISLSDAAKMVSMSSSQFSIKFKSLTGLNLVSYLNRMRIVKAAFLMKNRGTSMAEIAYTVGFSDQSHLYRHFKRVYKMTPRRFQEQLLSTCEEVVGV